AARAIRSRTAATRLAITSLLGLEGGQEALGGGHVLLVRGVHREVLLQVRDRLRDLVLADHDRAHVVVDLGVTRVRGRRLLEGGQGVVVLAGVEGGHPDAELHLWIGGGGGGQGRRL